MAAFNTKKVLYGSSSLIPTIAKRIEEDFINSGYEVTLDELSSGGYDISITKRGLFKAILGMKTALKVTLLPYGSNIRFDAGVGIWGQQAIPTAISMLFFWPVIITQIWGLIQQSKLDDKALEIAENVICLNSGNTIGSTPSANGSKFCTQCGTQNIETAKFCCGCGKVL